MRWARWTPAVLPDVFAASVVTVAAVAVVAFLSGQEDTQSHLEGVSYSCDSGRSARDSSFVLCVYMCVGGCQSTNGRKLLHRRRRRIVVVFFNHLHLR